MRWLLFVPLVLVLALFAHSNPQDIELRLWPFDVVWVAPQGIAMLVLAAAGFLVGALLVWVAGIPTRRRAAKMHQAAKLLEGEVAALKAREAKARRDADMGRVRDAEVVPALAGQR
jgi:putative membrane protein